MGFELLLLVALIIIFIISFCGLLQKIRQSYEQERRQIEQNESTLSEIYINPTFTGDFGGGAEGVFPCAPPPYSEIYDSPPKYEDIVKENININALDTTNLNRRV